MKNKNKGFTLIELLVVVAIIGILAAVGTVAYTGYTASAKKNAAKTLHSQAAKYIAAEIQKCTLNSDGTAMFGKIDCDSTETADKPDAANYAKFYAANSGVKNPYKPSAAGVDVDGKVADAVEGHLYLTVDVDDDTITLTMNAKTEGKTAAKTEEITIAVE